MESGKTTKIKVELSVLTHNESTFKPCIAQHFLNCAIGWFAFEEFASTSSNPLEAHGEWHSDAAEILAHERRKQGKISTSEVVKCFFAVLPRGGREVCAKAIIIIP